MKRLLLPVLFGTMAISHSFAQTPQSTEAKYYITELSHSAQHLLDITGLLKDGEPTATREHHRDVEFRLDSTVTFDTYVVEDSTRRSKTWNFYPHDNNIVNLHFAHDGTNWFISGRTSTFYDEFDHITDVIYYQFDAANTTYVEESRLQVYPHALSATLIDSFVVSTWREGSGWSPELTTRNTFDGSDLLVESVSEFVFFDETLTIIDRYTNKDGRVEKIETFHILEGEEQLGGTTFHLYQGDSLEIIISYIIAGPNDQLPENREERHYNDDRQLELVNHFSYDFVKQDWKFYRADGYVYDDLGRTRLYELVTIDETGFLQRLMTAYAYKHQLQLNVETNAIYDQSLEAWRILDRTWHYYTELVANDPVWQDAKELVVYPNPAIDFVQVQLTETVQAYLYDMNGRLIITDTLTPAASRLNLGHLPSGSYQLITQSAEEVRTAKVIRW